VPVMLPEQATPDLPADEMARLIEQAPPDRWPAGWAHWENVREAHRRLVARFLDSLPPYAGGHAGRGVVIGGGGARYFPCACVAIDALRRLGCRLPIQLWYLGDAELDARMERLVAPLGVECVDAHAVARAHPCRILRGWELKPYMIKHSPFREVLLLDADNVPLRDPTFLFEEPEYRAHGSIFWPDLRSDDESNVWHCLRPEIWAAFGLAYRDEPPVESGQILVDKARCWREVNLALWYAEHSDYSFKHVCGDKECFHFGWRRYGSEYASPTTPPTWTGRSLIQHDLRGRPLFEHHSVEKWRFAEVARSDPPSGDEGEYLASLRQFRRRWDGRIGGQRCNPRGEATNTGGTHMRASLVIASLDEGDKLWQTVSSCLETTAGLDCEVVVTDDGSTDGSVDELRRRFPQARVVAHTERIGVSPTKDMGGRSARGDVLVFLDGHCKPELGALTRLVEGVEAAGGRAILTPAVPALDAERWVNQMHQVGQGYRIDLEQFDCGWIGLERMRESAAVPGRLLYESPALIGCCVAISRATYERLWGFDPDMRMWGVEDLDFGLKAWLMGHPILHDPEAVVGHRFRAGFDNYAVPMEHIVANQLRMARKNFADPVWEEWLSRFRGRQPDWLWDLAWRLFEERRESIERERSYLLERRVHDEFWYAERFGLPWPPASLSGRFAAPAIAARPAEAGPDAAPAEEEPEDPRELFLEHYRHPRNRRMLANPDAVGTAESAGGATLTMYLSLDRAGTGGVRIGRIGFQSQRCGIAVAYASLLTESVLGWGLAQARGVDPSDLMGRFGEGAGAADSASLAVAALRRAIDRVPSG
jgi:GT2 family glycosyltransferase/NifU-like protein involved in Fe-S cluster formation